MKSVVGLGGVLILFSSFAWADLGIVQKAEKDRLQLVVFQKDLYVGATVALEDFRESRDSRYRVQGEVTYLSQDGYRSTVTLFPKAKRGVFLPGQVLYLRVLKLERKAHPPKKKINSLNEPATKLFSLLGPIPGQRKE